MATITSRIRLATLFTLLVTLSPPLRAQPPIQITVSTPKDTYLEGEPVWIQLGLVNQTQLPINVWDFSVTHSSIRYVLRNEHGDTLKYLGFYASGFGPKEPIAIIQPGDSIWDMDNLFTKFGIVEVPGYGFRHLYLPEGKYDFRIVGWTRSILRSEEDLSVTSNVIHFTVLPPTGEEAQVRQMYRDAVEAFLQRDKRKEEQLVLNVINLYPQSVYIGRSYEWIIDRYGLSTQEKARADSLQSMFIHQYPNDPLVYWYLPTYLQTLSDEAEREQFLRNIESQHPARSVLGKVARKLLKEKYSEGVR